MDNITYNIMDKNENLIGKMGFKNGLFVYDISVPEIDKWITDNITEGFLISYPEFKDMEIKLRQEKFGLTPVTFQQFRLVLHSTWGCKLQKVDS